jgi:hypothetical protein
MKIPANKFFLFTAAIAAVVAMSSCRTTKKVVESPNSTVKLKGEEVIQVFDSVMSREFAFKYLSAKASVSYTDKSGETNEFDINLRLQYDSIIWMSITPLLGIELARVLIRNDSVFVLDRLHKSFLKRDFQYFEDMLKTKMDFNMIQSVILGNYFQYLEKEKLRSLYEDDPYIILSTLNKRQAKRAAEEKDPNKPAVQDFWIDGNYRIAKSKISDDKRDRWVEASYSKFTDVGGKLFPNNMVLTIASSSPSIIRVEYSKIQSEDTLQLPFTVPEKYKVK